MFEAVTNEISVRVETHFLDEQSSPEDHHFFWAYYVEIENQGNEPVRLRARHWRITDGLGAIQEVTGEGVVGEQPVILPGETYRYTSGAPLGTPSGFMYGWYKMESGTGEDFKVDIPVFSLDSPYDEHIVN